MNDTLVHDEADPTGERTPSGDADEAVPAPDTTALAWDPDVPSVEEPAQVTPWTRPAPGGVTSRAAVDGPADGWGGTHRAGVPPAREVPGPTDRRPPVWFTLGVGAVGLMVLAALVLVVVSLVTRGSPDLAGDAVTSATAADGGGGGAATSPGGSRAAGGAGSLPSARDLLEEEGLLPPGGSRPAVPPMPAPPPDEGVTTAERDVFDLRRGDCLTRPDEGEVSTVEIVDCRDPHDAEVFALRTLDDRDLGADPSGADLLSSSDAACRGAFRSSFGRAVEELPPGDMTLQLLAPSRRSWSTGDRIAVCMVFYDGAVTGTLRERLERQTV